MEDRKKKIADAMKIVHKSDNEIMDMAEKYSKEVGFAGGTVAKGLSIPANEIGNIAKRMISDGAKRASRNIHLESGVAKLTKAKKQGGEALEKMMEQLRTGKGK
jgi:hypothetical protein